MSIYLYDKTSQEVSKRIALNYSTSFSLGIKLLGREFRNPVFSIYGMVRIADEIVDTFHLWDQGRMIEEFEQETYRAIEEGISTNPVLQAFQVVANQSGIGKNLIKPFFDSMKEDLDKGSHDSSSYQQYIYGSAEVVGLMCLKVFCKGDEVLYQKLEPGAKSLGSAFQKVNFLRDMGSDLEERGRVYFPDVDFHNFTEEDKKEIEKDIQKDFDSAYQGILNLPKGCRKGVYTSYIYYKRLFNKIKRTKASDIGKSRIRVPNGEKIILLVRSSVREKFMTRNGKN